MSNLSFVLVSGAWHTALCWDAVASLLRSAGHGAVAVALPSASANRDADFAGDVAAVRNAITAETERGGGRDVVVVAHSFGGVVGSSAVKGLAAPAVGRGRVVGLVLVASGFMPSGISFLDVVGGTPPPFWRIADGFAEFVDGIGPAELRAMFYHDLPAEEGDAWVGRLTKQSVKTMAEGGEHVYAGWQDVPCGFLATTEDKSHPIAMQRLAVQMARDAGAEVMVGEVASSHSPMLSRPQQTTDFLLRAAVSFVGDK